MKKTQSILYDITSLVLLCVLFWLCNCYPRHIIEFDLPGAVMGLLMNAVYFLIFDYFLIIVFSKNMTLFSNKIFYSYEPFYKRFELKNFFAVFLLQIVIDLLLFFIKTYSPIEYYYLIADVTVVIEWLLVYLILSNRGQRFITRTSFLLAFVSIIVVLIAFDVFLNYYLYSKYTELAVKYYDTSPYLIMLRTNAQFFSEIKLLVIDIVVGASFFVFHIVGTNLDDKKYDLSKKVTVFLLRMGILMFAFVLLLVFNSILAPNRMLLTKKSNSGSSINHEIDGPLDYEYSETFLYRGANNFEPCYSNVEVVFFDDNTEPLTVAGVFDKSEYPLYSSFDSDMNEPFVKLSVNDKDVYIYLCQMISFSEHEGKKTFKFEDINTLQESDIITSMCKQLLTDGNVFVFEYAYEYLNTYEPEFIAPFIERYSQGNFTSTESKWMAEAHYRDNYIVDIAMQISSVTQKQ